MIETLDQLLALLTTMSQTYERAKKEGDFDFFEVVQPFAEKVDQTLDPVSYTHLTLPTILLV